MTRRLALHWQILIGMAAGALVGVLINATLSRRVTEVVAVPAEAEGDEAVVVEALPGEVRRAVLEDSPAAIRITLEEADGRERQYVVDPTREGDGVYRSLEGLEEAQPEAHELFVAYGQSTGRRIGGWFQRLGGLFLRMLQMVAVPLIVASLLSGVMGLGSGEHLGRMFGRTLLYYVCTSFLAIVTGLLAVNLVRPGVGGIAIAAGGDRVDQAGARLGDVLFEQLEALIPANPLGALAEPNFLSIIAFTILFAVFAIRVGGAAAARIRAAGESVFETMMALTTAIIRLAPLGVFFLMAAVTATQGVDVFRSLAWYMIAVSAALAAHALVTLPLLLWLVARRSPWQFFQAMSPALLTAFSTASSNGTLPMTLANIERRGGVSNRVGSFVLPLGATVNMDGTALYEAVAVLFIAQLYHGENLPLAQQIVVAITALLASVGAAGIPHAGLVMMTIILQAVGLPLEMQGIILAVDRVLDMARTAVNVWSDSCGAAVIQALDDRGDGAAAGG